MFPQYKVENNILTTNKVISSFETGEIQLRKDSKKTLSKKVKYLLSQKSYLFRFSHLMQKNLRKKLIDFYYNNNYLTACSYCKGRGYGEGEVDAAIQTPKALPLFS
mgnify:CR=1 FL=1